jgi:hypothetical protein
MKAILSIFLMLQIVFSSMSITINMHYCLGELSDIAIFDDAEVCSFAKYFGTVTPKDGVAFKNKSCCGSEHHIINGQSHNTTLKSDLKNISIILAQEIVFTHIAKTQVNNSLVTPISNPLLVEPPIFLQVQSFRL